MLLLLRSHDLAVVASTQYVTMYPVITQTGSAFFYNDTFTDTDGTAIDAHTEAGLGTATWVNGGGSPTIEGGKATFTHLEAAYLDTYPYDNKSIGPDFEFTVDMTWDLSPAGPGNDQAHICYRGNVAESGWAASPSSVMLNSYWVQFSRSGGGSIDVRYADGGGFGSISGNQSGVGADADGDTLHLKVRVVGDHHQVRYWINGADEPDTWQFDFQDGTFKGPNVSLAAYTDGSANIAGYDNFRISGLSQTSDFFTGDDDDPWAVPLWHTVEVGGDISIQSDRGVVDGDSLNRVHLIEPALAPNFELTFDIQPNGTNEFWAFYYGDQHSYEGDYGADSFTIFGYPTGGVTFSRTTGGSNTALSGASLTWAPDDVIHIRLKVQDGVHSVKSWLNADPEPADYSSPNGATITDSQAIGPYVWFNGADFFGDGYYWVDNFHIYSTNVLEPSTYQTLASQFIVVPVVDSTLMECGPFEIGESYIGDCDELGGYQYSGANEPSVAYAITCELVTGAATVYEPNIAQGIPADVINASSIIYDPAVYYVVKSNLVADPAVVNAPTVAFVITVGALNDPAVVNSPQVYYIVKCNLVSDPAVVNSPQVCHVISVGSLSNPAVINQPGVAVGAVTVVVGALSDPAVVNTPSVAHVITVGSLSNPAVVNTPSVYYVVKVNLVTNPATVNAPQIYYVIKLDVVADPAVVNDPQVALGAGGAQYVVAQVVSNAAVVNSPQVYYVVKTNLISDPAVVNNPTVIPGSVTIVVQLVSNPATVNAPAVYYVVKLGVLSDPAVVNTPNVKYTQTVVVQLVSDAAVVNSPSLGQGISVPLLNTGTPTVEYLFTGTNGSSVTGWTTLTDLSAPDIFNGRMRVETGEGAYTDTSFTGNRTVAFDLIWASLGTSVSLFGTSSANTGGPDQTLDNAEVFNLVPLTGNPSFPGGQVVTTGAVEGVDTIHFYFELIDGHIYAYVWINSDPMPGSPSANWVATYTGSYFAFASINGTQQFDNFRVVQSTGVKTPTVERVIKPNLVVAPATVLTPTSVTIRNYIQVPVVNSNFKGVSYDFTGSNGAAPPVGFVTMGNGRTAPEIQSNQLQFSSTDGAYVNTGLTGDRTLRWDFTWHNIGVVGTYIAASNTNTSQSFFLDNGQNWNVSPFTNSVFGVSLSPISTGDIVHILIEIVGYNADIYVWKGAASQPGSPSANQTINPAKYGPYMAFVGIASTWNLDNFSAGSFSGVQTPAVAPQPVYVSVPALSDPAVVNAPKVTSIVQMPLLVTTGYGSGVYGGGSYGDGGGVLAPTVKRIVKVNVIADPAVVNTPTVLAPATLRPAALSDPAVVNAPRAYYIISMPVIVDGVAVNAPSVAFKLIPGVVSGAATVNAPEVIPGPVFLYPVLVNDPSEIFMPLILGGTRHIPLQVIGFLQPEQIIDVIEKVATIAPAEQVVAIGASNPAQEIDTEEQSNSIQLLYN